MITSLNVYTPEKRKGIRGIFDKLRRDRVCVEIKHARGVGVKQLTYINRSGRLCLDKIDKAIGSQRTRLLCCENICFPKNSGYKRFYSPLFSARLSGNMAVQALSLCKNAKKMNVAVYDPDAGSTGLAGSLLEYTNNVSVITDNPEPYYEEINAIADETGACAVVTHSRNQLLNCNLIVAPFEIEEKLPVSSETVVLTAARPKNNVSGLVYFRYNFKMPNGFALLKPEGLSEEYFCSALYTLAAQYELGSIVPDLCCNENEAQTVKSLCAYLERFA